MTTQTELLPPETVLQRAARVMARCDELAQCSETPDGLKRTFLSPAMHDAHALVRDWMREAGMTTRVDSLGNLIGHLTPKKAAQNGVFLIGSHLDTVSNAGKYDGMLGVLLGIEAVSLLPELPFGVEVIGFSEEEGVRFKTPYLGSRAIAGTFDPNYLDLRDGNGVSMRQSLRDFGLDADGFRSASYDSKPVLGYLEAHIEQGPVLEERGVGLGIVTDIAGQSRLQVRFSGQAGHAGTLPMNLRRDALAAAAEWIFGIETLARTIYGLVATVGFLEVGPNTPNVVAGEVTCSLDVRHAEDSVREQAVEEALETARDLAERRDIGFEILNRNAQPAVPMNAAMRRDLQRVCEELGVAAPAIVSGAGHDAAIMASLAPAAMLFLRSPGGISHNPAESVLVGDVALAIDAMRGFLQLLSE
jgi:allantoate deiminase